jgi:hypothetical protein
MPKTKTLSKPGTGIYFPVPGNHQVLEKILTAKSNQTEGSQPNKFRHKAPFLSLLRLFRLRGKFFL